MIRKLRKEDKEKQAKLYNDYADFYKVPMNTGILDTLENNWNGIRWITHSSNENAKKLYDKIANNTGFELYELKGD